MTFPKDVRHWDKAEVAILTDNWTTHDDYQIVALLKEHGYSRTVASVQCRRRAMNLLRPHTAESRARVGWPSVPANPVDQDKKLLRALLDALREQRRTICA